MGYKKDEKQEKIEQEKQEKTQKILAMITSNKKKKMMELKSMFDELKQNEIRLKEKRERLKKGEVLLKKWDELKNKNKKMNDTIMTMEGNHDINNALNINSNLKKQRMSTASIDTTIHGSISPAMLQKFQHKELKNKLCFGSIREHEMAHPELYELLDVEL